MGKKRTNDGREKSQGPTAATQKPRVGLNRTPPVAQHPVSSSEGHIPQSNKSDGIDSRMPNHNGTQDASTSTDAAHSFPANPQASSRAKRRKLQRLPDSKQFPILTHLSHSNNSTDATISKRPIHHPAPPSPFASADNPKILYITHTSPFIPTIKRVRKLLVEITKREQQSKAALSHPRHKRSKPLEANGRLKPADVERDIVEASGEKSSIGAGAEEVFVKATGRAIERALQIGVYFQGEDDCKVKVEMGSVQAIDDIEVRRKRRDNVDDGGEAMEGVEHTGKSKNKNKKQGRKWEDEDVPETRLRTLSSITVTVGLR